MIAQPLNDAIFRSRRPANMSGPPARIIDHINAAAVRCIERTTAKRKFPSRCAHNFIEQGLQLFMLVGHLTILLAEPFLYHVGGAHGSVKNCRQRG